MIGRLNDPLLVSAVGLGTAFINTLALNPLIGLNGALNTFVS